MHGLVEEEEEERRNLIPIRDLRVEKQMLPSKVYPKLAEIKERRRRNKNKRMSLSFFETVMQARSCGTSFLLHENLACCSSIVC